MCGRYALGIRASFVRHQLQQQGMPVEDAPEDDEVRETYNFPPGAYGLVYRADVPDEGVREEEESRIEPSSTAVLDDQNVHKEHEEYKYQLKAMKWGLIPFWTKRSPDYGSMMRTINCRDDSLIENKGMWNTMKQRKRCIVVAQGFYEWLKKGPNGKEKVPHFVKRTDGKLMYFAGLWDCVKYEDTDTKLYTYTVITTDSNKQLSFLHDRMPVILDPDSDEMRLWMNPSQNKWTKDLQAILKPYVGQLECYPVNTEVGKVGNNSANFIIPVDSKDNKKNIANFFDNANKTKTIKIEHEDIEDRQTQDHDSTENHAPLPTVSGDDSKRKHVDEDDENARKMPKTLTLSDKTSPSTKSSNMRKTRSAVSNEGATMKITPSTTTDDSQKITQFFSK